MRKGEVLSVALASIAAVLALSLIALRSLPVMMIDRIDASMILTPSAMRMVYPMKGQHYTGIDRTSLLSGLAGLPYLESVSLSYSHGALEVDGRLSDGIVVITPEGTFFATGASIDPISGEDAASLSSVMPCLSASSAYDASVILSLADAVGSMGGNASLITWMEYANDSEGSPEIGIFLDDLNAHIALKEIPAIGRIGESIDYIKDTNRSDPGRTVFSPMAAYGLYSDRLERLKG